MKFSAVELFCGCGGFSRGFSKSGKFNILLGNDIKPEALKTFEINHSSDDIIPATILKDIREVHLSTISDQLKYKGIEHGNLDCLIGGPPCQGFSQLRRSEDLHDGKRIKFRGYSKLSKDPRNDLVLRFLDIADYLKPKYLVIENVPQMLNHGFDGRLGKLSESVIEILEKDLGYSTKVQVVNTANYGVPQLRERAFFIASRIGPASFPNPTHCDPCDLAQIQLGLSPWVTVGESILDLPNPPEDQDNLGGGDLNNYLSINSEYINNIRSKTHFPFNHLTRKYRSSVINIIQEMQPGKTWDHESNRMRSNYEKMIINHCNTHMTTAETAKKTLIELGLINPVFYKDYYWSAYTRLSQNLPALTITANSNFLGSGRFTHPSNLRGITMREAARLQSFDDDFKFITSAIDTSETSRSGVGMDMVGEAVPPLMAKAIADHIALALEGAPSNGQKGRT